MKPKFTIATAALTTLLALVLSACTADGRATTVPLPTLASTVQAAAEQSGENADGTAAISDDLAGELCTDLATGATISYTVARTIAESSRCVLEGQLLESHSCNENSGTWWIDMTASKPGCNPACVVDANTGSAEINWRCTGALPPADEEAAPDGDAAQANFDYSGWGVFVNNKLGYEVKYPPSVTPTWDDVGEAVTFEGPLVDGEHWPMIFVAHGSSDFYRPPEGVAVRDWVESTAGQPENGSDEDTQIAGLNAYHVVVGQTQQSYPSDHYYFIKDGQMFSILILHTGNKQDWLLYDQFLQSFTFLQPDEPVVESAAVDDWQGVIGANPVGSQSRYFFDRQDGQRWVLSTSDETVLPAIAEAAWQGVQVQLHGVETPKPGQVNVTGLTVVGEAPVEPRNLSAFAQPSASSDLPSDRLGSYEALSAVDARPETPWCEGAEGSGTGEWLQLLFESPLEVTRIRLANGYSYSDDIFAKNNRIKRVTLIFTDGERLEWLFEDTAGWQEVPLARAPGPNMTITGVTISIEDVYPGSLYDDSCIGEVEIWGHAQ